jgi:hypothetical protein
MDIGNRKNSSTTLWHQNFPIDGKLISGMFLFHQKTARGERQRSTERQKQVFPNVDPVLFTAICCPQSF